MKDITTEEAVKILKDIPFYEQVENYSVEGPRYILKTNNRLKQARDIVLNELEKKNKIIDAMVKEMTDCEFEMQCSECVYECEKDYDQLYECNKQYFEQKVKDDSYMQ